MIAFTNEGTFSLLLSILDAFEKPRAISRTRSSRKVTRSPIIYKYSSGNAFKILTFHPFTTMSDLLPITATLLEAKAQKGLRRVFEEGAELTER